MKGLRITKEKPYTEIAKEGRCIACAGTGFYDAADRKGRPVKCAACRGTGKDEATR